MSANVNRSAESLDITLRPQDRRIFWTLWLGTGTAALAVAAWNLRNSDAGAWLLWVILLTFFTFVQVTGWTAFVWSVKGYERLKITAGELRYERVGWWLDRRTEKFAIADMSRVEVGSYYLGELEPTRVRLKFRQKNLNIGRGISRQDAARTAELLRDYMHGGASGPSL